MRRMMVVLLVGALLSLGLVPHAHAASSVTPGVDAATYTCTQPTFEDFEDILTSTFIPDGQTRNGLQFIGSNLLVHHIAAEAQVVPMHGESALVPFLGSARINFVYGPASSLSLLAAVDPDRSMILSVRLDAYDANGVLLESAAIDGIPYDINPFTTMIHFTLTRPIADMAYVEVHGEENSYLIDALCTDAPNAPAPPATGRFQQPLDPSTSEAIIRNKARAGRTIPVKLEIALDGVEQDATNVEAPPTIAVSEVACSTSAADAVESYTDSGSATPGTQQFRWSDDAPGLWIYNLDTRAFEMATGSCYRLDVYLGNTLVTSDATEWAVLEITK